MLFLRKVNYGTSVDTGVLTGATPETPIYFSVSLSAPVDVLANTTILYDAILLNEGGMYSPQYGIFTCPVTGIYHFMLSAKADAFSSAQSKALPIMEKLKFNMDVYVQPSW